VLFLKILGGVLALALGLYLGRSGSYRPDPEEIERALDGQGQTNKAARHFTPLGWLNRKQEASLRERLGGRRGRGGRFRLS
jgi:hypothetical protein